jgi:hypothetical protein
MQKLLHFAVKPSCPEATAGASFAATVEQCRRLVTEAIRLQAGQYAAVIGLSCSTRQFEQDLIEAILPPLTYHLGPKPERFSHLRKQMLRVEKEAASSAKHVRRLQSALDELSPIYRDGLIKQFGARFVMPDKVALALDTFSNLAYLYFKAFTAASASKEKHAPKKMLEFSLLITHMATVFQRHTGRAAKVTWNAHHEKYEGKFLALMEEVLPSVLKCSESLGSTMRCPSAPRARGKYIYDATRTKRVQSGSTISRTRRQS